MLPIQHLAGNAAMEGTTSSLADLDKTFWWTWHEYEDKNQEEQMTGFLSFVLFIVAVSMEMVNV